MRQAIAAAGLAVPSVVVGGTPAFPFHARRTGVECSPGTTVFWDAGYASTLPDLDVRAGGRAAHARDQPAGEQNRLCLDLGHKAVAAENPHPRVVLFGLEDATAVGHSEEHLVLETGRAARLPRRLGALWRALARVPDRRPVQRRGRRPERPRRGTMAGGGPRPEAHDLTMSSLAARATGLVGLVLVTCAPLSAQELEPKAYSASPVGATFLVTSVARSAGSIVFDPSIPITDVDARINAAFFGVGTTFDLVGKLALVSVAIPYAWGEVSGRVFEEARTVTRAGVADTRVRFSVNLRGNDAMHLGEFVKAPRKAIVGTSVTVLVPTGEYDRTKLINLGNHRWGFKPEVGLAVPIGRWDIDAYTGVWLFTANDDFFPGSKERTQDPILAIQGHVSYTFKPRLWLAVDSTWYSRRQVASRRRRTDRGRGQLAPWRHAVDPGEPQAVAQDRVQQRRVRAHGHGFLHDRRRLAVSPLPEVTRRAATGDILCACFAAVR